LNSLIRNWRTDPDTAPNFTIWRQARPGLHKHIASVDLPALLLEALSGREIDFLYSHQLQTWDHAHAGKNIVIARTATARRWLTTCRDHLHH